MNMIFMPSGFLPITEMKTIEINGQRPGIVDDSDDEISQDSAGA
jgi:hypothetical protein